MALKIGEIVFHSPSPKVTEIKNLKKEEVKLFNPIVRLRNSIIYYVKPRRVFAKGRCGFIVCAGAERKNGVWGGGGEVQRL